jgi:hypothetical protein
MIKEHADSLGPPPNEMNVALMRQVARSKAIVAAEAELARAHKTVQSLQELITDSDGAVLFLMRASGSPDVKTTSFSLARAQSSVAEADSPMSDDQGAAQCWTAWQVLFASISKLSVRNSNNQYEGLIITH